jgi:non-specific serine/threonine protein kinase
MAGLGGPRRQDERCPQLQRRRAQLSYVQFASRWRREVNYDARGFSATPCCWRDVPTMHASLPSFLTTFIGRRNDIAACVDLVSGHRLVTLVGPGGIGKTRLAVKVAESSITRWKDGTAFVDYSGTDSGSAVLGELASALEVTPAPNGTMHDQLLWRLSDYHGLLLLDNCERMREPLSMLAASLLERCPRLHVLATSRERLGIVGEALYNVAPLAIPPADIDTIDSSALRYDSVTMFRERALANRSDLSLGPDDIPYLVQICSRLDGIPLALELAAGRLRTMSLRDLSDALRDRFRILQGGPAGRQQSLWATVDWSYQLLTPEEQRLAQQVSVFAGGFRMDAAEAVTAETERDFLDVAQGLVDKSMLRVDTDPDGRTRFRMLDSVREYGLEKLTASGETEGVRTRHLHHYRNLADHGAAHFQSSDASEWLDRLQADYDNIVMALIWSRDHAREHHVAMLGALGRYWSSRGNPAEGRHWVEQALDDRSITPSGRLPLLRWAVQLAAFEQDLATARRLGEQSLAIAQDLGDAHQTAHAHLMLGNLLALDPTPQPAESVRAHYQAADRIYEQLCDDFGRIPALMNLADVAVASGELEKARAFGVHALGLAEGGRWDEWVSRALSRLGLVAALQVKDAEAEVYFRSSLNRGEARNSSHRLSSTYIFCLGAMAAMAARQGNHDHAARLTGAFASALERSPVKPVFPRDLLRSLERWHEKAHQPLSPSRYQALWRFGHELSDGEARLLALDGLSSPSRISATLSTREMEIVRLIADGLTNRRIAAQLKLSVRTVDSHVDHIRDKLGVRQRAQIVRWLLETGGVTRPERSGAPGSTPRP